MIDKHLLRKAQLIMLDVLIEVDRICKKHNIQYWITDGTFLGAVRHKGFIPWDDDIDVCMLEKDYKKFIKIAKRELNTKKFFLQTEKTDKYCFTPWARVRSRNNYGVHNEEKYHQGLGIDIFPMSYFPKINKKFYKIIYLLKEANFQKDYSLKNIIKRIIVFFKIKKYFDIIFNKMKNRDEINIGYSFGFLQLYNTNDIFPLSEIEFEGHKFPCPNNADAYLKELYGDTYMKLPPEKDRIWHVKEIRLNEKCFFEKELERTGRKLYEE